jgi:hypothetical protein
MVTKSDALQETRTIEKSIQIAVKHPIYGKALLAKTFVNCISDNNWITQELKIHFCVQFLVRVFDYHFDSQPNTLLIEHLKGRSIYFGMRLLRRYPRRGVEVIVELLLIELTYNQKLSRDDLLLFYGFLFNNLFSNSCLSVDRQIDFSENYRIFEPSVNLSEVPCLSLL